MANPVVDVAQQVVDICRKISFNTFTESDVNFLREAGLSVGIYTVRRMTLSELCSSILGKLGITTESLPYVLSRPTAPTDFPQFASLPPFMQEQVWEQVIRSHQPTSRLELPSIIKNYNMISTEQIPIFEQALRRVERELPTITFNVGLYDGELSYEPCMRSMPEGNKQCISKRFLEYIARSVRTLSEQDILEGITIPISPITIAGLKVVMNPIPPLATSVFWNCPCITLILPVFDTLDIAERLTLTNSGGQFTLKDIIFAIAEFYTGYFTEFEAEEIINEAESIFNDEDLELRILQQNIGREEVGMQMDFDQWLVTKALPEHLQPIPTLKNDLKSRVVPRTLGLRPQQIVGLQRSTENPYVFFAKSMLM